MSHRSFILVFPSDALWLMANVEPLKRSLNPGDEIYALDGNIVFIRSDQEIKTLLERLQDSYFNDRQFFLAEITDADRAGNMPSAFWKSFSLRRTEEVAA